MGFPGGSEGKESACNVGDLGSISGLGRSPGAGHGNPLQYSCLENPHGQRSLLGYSPWGCKESDTTEQLSTAQHILYTHFNFLQNSVFHIAMSYHSPFYATIPSRSISPNHDLPDHVAVAVAAKLCLTLCNPLDCSPWGSSDCEISQARILEGVAISFSTHLFLNS